MAHPFAGQAQASEKRRLGRLTGKPGKPWGSSSMYKRSGYPTTHAGTERPMTISGGTAKKNAGRKPQKFADGGEVGGSRPTRLGSPSGGGVARGRGRKGGRQKNTTNIIIADRGGGAPAARPVPVPVNRPVPVPVPVGGAAPAGRPVVTAPAAAAPPVAAPPVAAGPPVGVPPVRPPMGMPGMADGGLAGYIYHNEGRGYKEGGVVKKADGGFLKEDSPDGYRGFPHSPTTEVDDAVSAKKDGGGIKKAQIGGLGRPIRAGQQRRGGFRPAPVPGVAPGGPGRGVNRPGGPPTVPLTGGLGFKKGGKVHDDEAQDRKLFKKMIAKEEKAEKHANGGVAGSSGPGRLKRRAAAAAIPAKTEI